MSWGAAPALVTCSCSWQPPGAGPGSSSTVTPSPMCCSGAVSSLPLSWETLLLETQLLQLCKRAVSAQRVTSIPAHALE